MMHRIGTPVWRLTHFVNQAEAVIEESRKVILPAFAVPFSFSGVWLIEQEGLARAGAIVELFFLNFFLSIGRTSPSPPPRWHPPGSSRRRLLLRRRR